MNFSIIAALDQNGGIGKNNKLPWHISADLKRFKELTMDGTVIMGRNTWESIPEKYRPFSGRLNIVLTGNLSYQVPEGVKLASSIDGALAICHEPIFVIGGAKLFEEAIRHSDCDSLVLTHVEGIFDCDVFFPHIPAYFEKSRESEEMEEKGIKFRFVDYERNNRLN